jgi:hypothetical protein
VMWERIRSPLRAPSVDPAVKVKRVDDPAGRVVADEMGSRDVEVLSPQVATCGKWRTGVAVS